MLRPVVGLAFLLVLAGCDTLDAADYDLGTFRLSAGDRSASGDAAFDPAASELFAEPVIAFTSGGAVVMTIRGADLLTTSPGSRPTLSAVTYGDYHAVDGDVEVLDAGPDELAGRFRFTMRDTSHGFVNKRDITAEGAYRVRRPREAGRP